MGLAKSMGDLHSLGRAKKKCPKTGQNRATEQGHKLAERLTYQGQNWFGPTFIWGVSSKF